MVLWPMAPLHSSSEAGLFAVLVLLTLPNAQGQCTNPEQLPYAKPTKLLTEFPVGTNLRYVCRPGFHRKSFVLTCLPNNTWSHVESGYCMRRSCRNPPDIHNGKMNVVGGIMFGSTIHYVCDEGFRLIGEPSMTCILVDSTVAWDNEPPVCERIPCGPPPKIANGYFRGNIEQNLYGAVVTYYCQPSDRRGQSFTLVGEKILYCTSKDNRVGVWSSPAPKCLEPNTCAPPDIEHGIMVPANRSLFSLGDTVTVMCLPGYVLTGPSSVSCQAQNRWKPELPACSQKITCTNFPRWLPHGRVFLPPTLQLGARVTFTCNEGFRLEGSQSSYCILNEERAIWNSSLPTCKPISCPQPPSILNGRHTGEAQSVFSYGTTVTYSCDSRPRGGRAWELKGERTLRCTSDGLGAGVWSVSAPHCRLGDPIGFCGAPETFPFAEPTTLRQDSKFPVGTSLIYKCRPGYVGSAFSISCMENLNWSLPVKDHCRRLSCSPPLELHNGMVLATTDTGLGATVNYSCNEGYRLLGASFATCLLSGSDVAWDHKAPTCERIFCSAPPAIANGTHSGGPGEAFPYGAVVTYSCNPRQQWGQTWELEGESMLRCTSNDLSTGIWSSPAPRCSLRGPTACPQPPKTPHGQLVGAQTSPYFPGMSVSFTCDPGYLLVGETLVFCTDRSTWSSPSPHCREVNCSLPLLLEGVWEQLQGGQAYRYGDSVMVGCVDGYTLEGSPWSQCQADHSWAPQLAICVPRLSAVVTVLLRQNRVKKNKSLTLGSRVALIVGVFFPVLAICILPAIAYYWLIVKPKKGKSTDGRHEEVIIHLCPQNSGGSPQAQAGDGQGSGSALP